MRVDEFPLKALLFLALTWGTSKWLPGMYFQKVAFILFLPSTSLICYLLRLFLFRISSLEIFIITKFSFKGLCLSIEYTVTYIYVPQVLPYCLIMVHLQKTEAKRTGLNLEHNKTLLAPREFCLGLNYGLKLIWHPLIEIHELPHFLLTHTPLNSSNVKAKALHCFYQKNLNTQQVLNSSP